MRVAIVNTHANSGGAARAATRLKQGLRSSGVDAFMYSLTGNDSSDVIRFKPSMDFSDRVIRFFRKSHIAHSDSKYIKRRPEGLELFSDDRSYVGKEPLMKMPDCDIVNLHWVARFLDYRSLPIISCKPVVWTLHDMNPFTGGCHYDGGCDRYCGVCGRCPQLGSSRTHDLSFSIWQRKSKAYSLFNPEGLHIVSPSRWLAGEARKSALLGRFSVTVIPNGVDINLFSPRNATGFRKVLDIPPDARVILFVAESITKRRKGVSILLDALKLLGEESKYVLVSVGGGSIEAATEIRHMSLGRIEDERILSAIYSMADVFVIPSVEDNLPNTVLESMACGTPVVGFDVGGIRDMVHDGQTGALIKKGDAGGMARAIRDLLVNGERLETMASRCREIVLSEYSLDIQARRYIELYEDMIENRL